METSKIATDLWKSWLFYRNGSNLELWLSAIDLYIDLGVDKNVANFCGTSTVSALFLVNEAKKHITRKERSEKSLEKVDNYVNTARTILEMVNEKVGISRNPFMSIVSWEVMRYSNFEEMVTTLTEDHEIQLSDVSEYIRSDLAKSCTHKLIEAATYIKRGNGTAKKKIEEYLSEYMGDCMSPLLLSEL